MDSAPDCFSSVFKSFLSAYRETGKCRIISGYAHFARKMMWDSASHQERRKGVESASYYLILTSLSLVVMDHSTDVLCGVPLTFLKSCHFDGFSILFHVLGCGASAGWRHRYRCFYSKVIRNVKVFTWFVLACLQFSITSMTKLWFLS